MYFSRNNCRYFLTCIVYTGGNKLSIFLYSILRICSIVQYGQRLNDTYTFSPHTLRPRKSVSFVLNIWNGRIILFFEENELKFIIFVRVYYGKLDNRTEYHIVIYVNLPSNHNIPTEYSLTYQYNDHYCCIYRNNVISGTKHQWSNITIKLYWDFKGDKICSGW